MSGETIENKRSLYSHCKKAGNKGDVWKRFILLSVVEGLLRPRESDCGGSDSLQTPSRISIRMQGRASARLGPVVSGVEA